MVDAHPAKSRQDRKIDRATCFSQLPFHVLLGRWLGRVELLEPAALLVHRPVALHQKRAFEKLLVLPDEDVVLVLGDPVTHDVPHKISGHSCVGEPPEENGIVTSNYKYSA